MTIVLVHDDPMWQLIIGKLLSHMGLPFHIANNQSECLDLVKTVKPDLILLDTLIGSEGIGAIAILTALKDDQELKHIPVVIVSADMSNRGQDELAKIGTVSYLSLPFTPETLRWLIGEIIK